MFLDKHNFLSQWWDDIPVHSHKQTRGKRCTNVRMLHKLHTSVHGHKWIHTCYSSTYLSTRRCASLLSSCTGGGLGLVGKLFDWLAEDW